jgi:hypothetical protein
MGKDKPYRPVRIGDRPEAATPRVAAQAEPIALHFNDAVELRDQVSVDNSGRSWWQIHRHRHHVRHNRRRRRLRLTAITAGVASAITTSLTIAIFWMFGLQNSVRQIAREEVVHSEVASTNSTPGIAGLPVTALSLTGTPGILFPGATIPSTGVDLLGRSKAATFSLIAPGSSPITFCGLATGHAGTADSSGICKEFVTTTPIFDQNGFVSKSQ